MDLGGTGEKQTDSWTLQRGRINSLADLLSKKVRQKEVPHTKIRKGKRIMRGKEMRTH